MPRTHRTQRTVIGLARITMMLVAILLAHDALMAADAHAGPTHAAHTEATVPECGPSDGVMQHAPVIPAVHTDHALLTDCWPTLPDADCTMAYEVPPTLDASALRAWLQVYRN